MRVCFDPGVCHTVCTTGGADGTSPSRLRVFTNRDDLDFGTAADTQPIQEWDLLENPRGEVEYPTQCVGHAEVVLHDG